MKVLEEKYKNIEKDIPMESVTLTNLNDEIRTIDGQHLFSRNLTVDRVREMLNSGQTPQAMLQSLNASVSEVITLKTVIRSNIFINPYEELVEEDLLRQLSIARKFFTEADEVTLTGEEWAYVKEILLEKVNKSEITPYVAALIFEKLKK